MDDLKLSKASADFVGAFAGLSRRLADIAIWVDSLNLHYGAFGSWELTVRKGDEAVRFVFDGRDSFIEIETSPAPLFKNSSARNWTKAEARALCRDEAISHAEQFLRAKFTNSA